MSDKIESNGPNHLRLFAPEDSADGQVPELERVLDAWHTATERLQKTHEVLRDEVRRLTQELEVKNRELARKNRLADLGQMASHVAHEVRNGLAPVTLYLSLLRRRLNSDVDAISVMDKVEAGFTALEATVTDLLNFTSDRDPICRSFAIGELLEDVCESLRPQISAQRISVDIDAHQHCRILADRSMLRRAILNLLINAVDAMPEGGQLVITAVDSMHGLEIEVADSGPGFVDDTHERAFEPFYTTKSEGTGLGLAIVYQIAEAHGGNVSARNCPEGGAAVTIYVPRQAMEAAA